MACRLFGEAIFWIGALRTYFSEIGIEKKIFMEQTSFQNVVCKKIGNFTAASMSSLSQPNR